MSSIFVWHQQWNSFESGNKFPSSTTSWRRQDKAEKLLWTMFFLTVSLNYPLSTKPMSGSTTWCGLPTWSAWIRPNIGMLNVASASTWKHSWDTYFTAIQSWCNQFCIAPLFANLTCYEWHWPEWKFEDQNYSMSHLQTDQSCSDAIWKKTSF